MNLVGKILTVVNLILAMLFFAFAGATYTANTGVRSQLAKLKKDADEAKAGREAAFDKVNLAAAGEKALTMRLDESSKSLTSTKSDASKQQELQRDEITDLRKQLAATNQQLVQSAAETTFRKNEVEEHRKTEADLNKQLKDRGKELSDARDQVALLRNEIEVLKDRLRTLESNERALRRILADKNINVPADPKELEAKLIGNVPTPEVVSKITKVDAAAKMATIAIGENDGLKPGMKLDAWRTAPRPKYLGEVTVFSVDSNRAVVRGESLVAPLEVGDDVGKSALLHR